MKYALFLSFVLSCLGITKSLLCMHRESKPSSVIIPHAQSAFKPINRQSKPIPPRVPQSQKQDQEVQFLPLQSLRVNPDGTVVWDPEHELAIICQILQYGDMSRPLRVDLQERQMILKNLLNKQQLPRDD